MHQYLQSQGAQYEITFRFPERLSNSHRALQAAEYARSQGIFKPFHDALFRAYFTEGLGIGQWTVLLHIAQEVGLAGDPLMNAIEAGFGQVALQEAQKLGKAFGVDSTPTFIIDRRYRVTGAQPYDLFRKALGEIQSGSS